MRATLLSAYDQGPTYVKGSNPTRTVHPYRALSWQLSSQHKASLTWVLAPFELNKPETRGAVK